MKQSILDRLMSRKGLYVGFWFVAIIVVTALIVFTANLAKEVPPIPKVVKSASGRDLPLPSHSCGLQGLLSLTG